jgi:hypothetical protein
MLDTQQRYGHTAKKMITLTHEGRAQIQKFAEAHGMNFSATIESLALIGMKADLTDLLIPLLREVVDKAMQRNFNRISIPPTTARSGTSATTTGRTRRTTRRGSGRFGCRDVPSSQFSV